MSHLTGTSKAIVVTGDGTTAGPPGFSPAPPPPPPPTTLCDDYGVNVAVGWGTPAGWPTPGTVNLDGVNTPTFTWMDPDVLAGDPQSTSVSVSAGKGHIDYDAIGSNTSDDGWAQGIVLDPAFTFPVDTHWQSVEITRGAAPLSRWAFQFYYLTLWGYNYTGFEEWVAFAVEWDAGLGSPSAYINDFNGTLVTPTANVGIPDWSGGTLFDVRMRLDSTGAHFKLWQSSSSEPSSWTVEAPFAGVHTVADLANLRAISIESDVVTTTSPFPFAGQLYVDTVCITQSAP